MQVHLGLVVGYLDVNNSNNSQADKQKGRPVKLNDTQQNDEVHQLDSDYKDVFMRRLASDIQNEGLKPNELRKRFGLTKDSLDKLLPEYKLLLNRLDLNLYRYAQEVLTARYLQSKHIDSDLVIASSSTSHNLVEVEPEAAEASQKRYAEHGQRWQEVTNQRLHKAGRAQLENVMELLRTEDRPVAAFSEGQHPLSASSEASVSTGDRGSSEGVIDGADVGGGGGGGVDGAGGRVST